MKVLCISDTHGKHDEILPSLLENKDGSIDAIIHAGDVSNVGRKKEIIEFLEWFSKLPFKYRIFVSGNHDFFFDHEWKPYSVAGQIRFGGLYAGIYTKEIVEETLAAYPSVTYLNDSGIEIDGVKIWGSPVQPFFHDWAFNRNETDIQKHWNLIPLDTDILITHGPLKGYLDMTIQGDVTGCPYLLDYVQKMPNLKLHVCGHIHEAHGKFQFADGATLINASVLNHNYHMKNKPFIIDINKI